jgi:penicillin-binding protein 1C
MWDVSGVTGAAPVWAALANYLHRQTPSRAPAAPEGVVRTKITYQNDIEPARDDWFLSGTEMSRIGLSANAEGTIKGTRNMGAARIATPTNGTIFALDPDIPAARQRVWFESGQGAPSGSTWRLDNKPAGREPRMAWLPWPGHHTLELIDKRGEVVDSVKFEVRGAFVRIKTKG